MGLMNKPLTSAMSGDPLLMLSQDSHCLHCTHYVPFERAVFLIPCNCGPFHDDCIARLKQDSRLSTSFDRHQHPVSVEYNCPKCGTGIASVCPAPTTRNDIISGNIASKHIEDFTEAGARGSYATNPGAYPPPYPQRTTPHVSPVYREVNYFPQQGNSASRLSPNPSPKTPLSQAIDPSSWRNQSIPSFNLPPSTSPEATAPPLSEFQFNSPAPEHPIRSAPGNRGVETAGFERNVSGGFFAGSFPRQSTLSSEWIRASPSFPSSLLSPKREELLRRLPSVPKTDPPSPVLKRNSSHEKIRSGTKGSEKGARYYTQRSASDKGTGRQPRGNQGIRSGGTSRRESSVDSFPREFSSMNALDMAGGSGGSRGNRVKKPSSVHVHHFVHRGCHKGKCDACLFNSTQGRISMRTNQTDSRHGSGRSKSSKWSSRT